jgi:hypothetical protein
MIDVIQEIPEESNELKPGDKVRIVGQSTVGDLIEINKKMR